MREENRYIIINSEKKSNYQILNYLIKKIASNDKYVNFYSN